MNDRLISILSWFFGVLIIFAGLRAFSISFIGAILSILGGIALLPIFQKKIESMLKQAIQKRWFVIIALLLMVISGNLIGKAEQNALQNGTASQELKDREANRIKLEQERQQLEAKKAEEEAVREAQRQKRDRIINIEVESKMALMNFLKDPDSAEVRNQNGNCGEVNSKNGFGGYTGFKRYIASPTVVAIEGENMTSSEFESVWNKVCH
jgi:hypothetical protein